MRRFLKFILIISILSVIVAADYRNVFFDLYPGDTTIIKALGDRDIAVAEFILFEGATANDYEATFTTVDPTTDNVITMPDYTGALPLVIKQGYTQTSHSEASAADVTGSDLTLADG